jgi:hypothetical protein
MLSLKIVSGAALAVMALVVAPGAIAQPKDNAVNNTQGNWAETRARLNADIRSVSQDVAMTAAAIGNSFSAELGGTSTLNHPNDHRSGRLRPVRQRTKCVRLADRDVRRDRQLGVRRHQRSRWRKQEQGYRLGGQQ